MQPVLERPGTPLALAVALSLFALTHLRAAERPIPKVTLAAPPKAATFELETVRLLDGPFKQGQDIAVQYLLRLEPDRFLADWFDQVHGNLTDEQMQKVLVAEHGGLNETFADLYADTGDERYLRQPVAAEAGAFRTAGVGRPHEVALRPFFRLHDRRYTVYLDQFTAAAWAQREAEIRAAQEREAALAARTVDLLRIGEMQPERDHHLQGQNTSAGDLGGRKWRHATDGGWFAFDLKVEPDQPQELQVTYWGSDAGNRVFDLLVDGEKVATQRLENNRPGRFEDISYPLPPRMTRGKTQLNVRFQAHPGAWAGGVFGVRLLRTSPKPE